ncbi:hydroxymethylglutaryl-CoA reductase, degradative [Apilactobacillus apisilvae]|uniref:3-hydroxy-3-methylglutaryl coenzyme A reductase n=1 Tax=Apilactobacillus apisilvae TaxID=2923364 RepID=A0ABY4PGP1_9LACO|nr:hydroxymethylglutaryl-CoA reductase, degradative [Apilactobacillus apisilvae]UQS84979.1 hydroxymethylglutaryl-CoA reductase, degradative [Apilactobacillus apisilvae]
MGTFNHFYHKSYDERINIIGDFSELNSQELKSLYENHNERNNSLIENYITDYSLPEGIAVNFLINGEEKVAPMVTEEPSVIAAASNGARMFAKNGGLNAKVISSNLTGQIIVKTDNFNLLFGYVNTHRDKIIAVANNAHPSILKYGGGAKEVSVRQLDENYCSIDLFVDVAEAMGANIMNSMLEALANFLKTKASKDILMSILSNYSIDSLVTVSGSVKFSQLGKGNFSGKEVANKIVEASHIAQIDTYRATTHNKGIMNGIDAFVMAMGNDWRAVESGIHAYASRNGHYQGLSHFMIKEDTLYGEMTLPLSLGFIGGATKVLPKVKINQRIAKVHSKKELMQFAAAIGLAQNLAALKALVTEGIQKGHMNLQLNSLAMTAGSTDEELFTVVQSLRQMQNPNLTNAKQIIQNLRK